MAGNVRNGQRLLAVAFFLLVLSFVLPVWTVSHSAGDFTYEDIAVYPFRPDAPASETAAPIATGVLWALAAATLMVTVASREVFTEGSRAAKWARNSGLLMIGGLVGVAFWPEGVGHFWGQREFMLEGSESVFQQTARPGLGFWAFLLSFVAVLASFWHLPKPPRGTGMKPLVLAEKDYKLLTLFTKITGIFLFASGTIQIADWGRVGLGLLLVVLGIIVTMAPVPMTVVRPDTLGDEDDDETFIVNE